MSSTPQPQAGPEDVRPTAEPSVIPQGLPLQGKVALVTGGAKRVGRAIALRLAQQGADVAFTYNRSAAEAEQTLAELRSLGRSAEALSVQLEQPNAAEIIYDWFTARFGRLDALVNNASCFPRSPLGQIDAAMFDFNMAVNARTPLLLIQAFASMLASNHRADDPTSTGRVVNFIDIHVMGQPLTNYAAYNASKAALKEITMTLSMELAPSVTVNALAPGVVAWAESYSEELRRSYMQRVPMDRPGTPDDAADAALFLIRDAAYCTGQIIRLDGGRLLT
jgi:pteridine reductase